MIVVFVVDTSPSMGKPASEGSGLSRLDLAKQAVEEISKQLRKRHVEHHRMLQEQNQDVQRSLVNAGLGLFPRDSLLLLSTSRQYPNSSTCAAGGRLLVSLSDADLVSNEGTGPNSGVEHAILQHSQIETFQRELKGLKASDWDSSSDKPFPEGAGGAVGLNVALSSGLQLLSRYRLHDRQTENFGMGRIPSTAMISANGNPATAALQPACLILLTDGECLAQSPKHGGGALQLQFGSLPLREFYKRPFRWDQRIFCIGVGGSKGASSSRSLGKNLCALCEDTGGSHWMLRGAEGLHQITEGFLRSLCPPLPTRLPLSDPLYRNLGSVAQDQKPAVVPKMGSMYVSGGPVCCFQALELDETERPHLVMRAMLLYTGSTSTSNRNAGNFVLGQPLWCIPESHFPDRKLDTLPPRSAQPLLFFSKHPANLGSKSFESAQLIKMLERLDQLCLSIAQHSSQPVKFLHRDTYICEWLGEQGSKPIRTNISSRQEYFPVFTTGGKSLSEDEESYLNIGVLHVPFVNGTLSSGAGVSRLSTLTLLPPDPHILLPLLIRAAEATNRTLSKRSDDSAPVSKLNVPMDDHWRVEFTAYNSRVPAYYQHALRRCLRTILPSSVHSLLHAEPVDSINLLCMSKLCLKKIRHGEQSWREKTASQEYQEASLKKRTSIDGAYIDSIGYGQYDPRTSIESYLAALRCMPSPPKAPQKEDSEPHRADAIGPTSSNVEEQKDPTKTMVETLGDTPASCLMAYYNARRRWLFGGTGLSSRGLHIDGVNNDGTNTHRCNSVESRNEPSLLSLAGVGVSMASETTTSRMGNFRERLLFARSPVVGYGSNDYGGVSATTAVDGSPRWSVDDDALPVAFFDSASGEFTDSVQARMKSRLMVNFGNPFKEKRADSLVPEKYRSQLPSVKQNAQSDDIIPITPPGSPPHDSFDSMEEGEAMFVRKSPTRSSPQREETIDEEDGPPPPKRSRSGSEDSQSNTSVPRKDIRPPPPRPPVATVKAPTKPTSLSMGTSSTANPHRPKPAAGPPPPKHTRTVPPPPAKPGIPPRKVGPSPHPPAKPKAPPRPPQQKPADVKTTGGIKKVDAEVSVIPKAEKPDEVSPAAALDPLQHPDVKPNVSLPAGWMSVWSKSQRRWYFFNTKNNQSVWEWPPPGGIPEG